MPSRCLQPAFRFTSASADTLFKMMYAVALSALLAVSSAIRLPDDWASASGWEDELRGSGYGALAGRKSAAEEAVGAWGLRDKYRAEDGDQAEAIGAAGIRNEALAGGAIRKKITLRARDSGYSDTGYRNVKGSVDTGRSTSFLDTARKAGIAASAGKSGSRLVYADSAKYEGEAGSAAAAGGLKAAGSLEKRAGLDAGIRAAKEEASGKAEWKDDRSDGWK